MIPRKGLSSRWLRLASRGSESLRPREKTMQPTRLPRQIARISVLAAFLFSRPIVSQTQPQPSSPATATSPSKRDQNKVNCTSNGTYVNSKGQTVPRPENCSGAPHGATAQCRDGTYSFSRSRRGTCSHHGGVAKWL